MPTIKLAELRKRHSDDIVDYESPGRDKVQQIGPDQMRNIFQRTRGAVAQGLHQGKMQKAAARDAVAARDITTFTTLEVSGAPRTLQMQ